MTDTDGAQSIAFVNVTVLAGKDYPPVAVAGNPVLIHLPKDDVYLYGNESSDDKVTHTYSVASLCKETKMFVMEKLFSIVKVFRMFF